MDEETSARALLPCLLPLDTLQKIRDQNLLVLEPVDTLKQRCREQNTEEKVEELFRWKEYRLHGKPQILKEFHDLFLLENGEYDKHRAIWIPESDAFVSVDPSRVQRDGLPRAYQEGVFGVALSSDMHRYQNLSVFSSTVEQAMPCLEFLFGLHDSHFQDIFLSYSVLDDEEGEPPICPLTNRCLEKLLIQSESRQNTFYYISFTPELSRVLATSGTIIGLNDCLFPDGGVAFVDAARQHSSLTKLTLWERLPFDDRNFVWSLVHLNLEYLRLSNIDLHGESCRAVATAEINYLHLEHCEFEDDEAVQVLVDNVREELGPRGLSLDGEPFESPERFGDFMNALRGNTYLERLDIGDLDVRDGDFQALVAALSENRGLTHLGFSGCTVDDHCWEELMGAIAKHPSLRTLSFEEIRDENESLVFEHQDPMHSLASMLAENEQVDEIEVDDAFDRDVWDTVIVPRLEINSYRKRLLAIQTIQNPATRAAVTARALARLGEKPSLQFMLVSQNQDIVSSYLT
jgi:hypothetical protein